MSGPREPWRSRGLSKRAVDGISRRLFDKITAQTNGEHVGRGLPVGLDLIEPRETRERDRSLNGKARRRARKAVVEILTEADSA